MLFQTGFGVYIENDHVSMAYLKGSFRDVKLAAYAVYPLDEEKSIGEKLGKVGKLVGSFIEKNRISSSEIFVGIPRDLVVLRYIELPLLVKENLRETLGYEMDKYIPFPADDIYFDYQIVSEDRTDGKLKVLLMAVKKEAIRPFFDLRSLIGTGISGIEVSSTAIANFFYLNDNISAGDPLALIYLKRNNLELDLTKDGLLNYSRSVRMDKGDEELHTLICRELRPLCQSLGTQDGAMKTIILGLDTDLELISRLREETDLDVELLDLSQTDIPSDTIMPAYGLALKGIYKAPMDINLLPVELRKKANKIGYYMMFVLAGLLVLSVLGWGGGNALRQRLYLNQLNVEINRKGAEVKNIGRIEKKCTELEDRIDYVNSLYSNREAILNILRELSRRIPEGAWVRRLKFSEEEVQIEGHAVSASELISLLEASSFFKDVVFLSTITKDKDGRERFRIGLKLS